MCKTTLLRIYKIPIGAIKYKHQLLFIYMSFPLWILNTGVRQDARHQLMHDSAIFVILFYLCKRNIKTKLSSSIEVISKHTC